MKPSATKPIKRTTPKRLITNTHKDALAKGREESRIVGRYLEELEATRPKRGRKRTTATIKKRISAIDQKMATADALSRLNLIQEKKDLLEEISRNDKSNELDDLESQFIKVGKSYGDRKGINYSTWRTVGVPISVLEKAGINRKGERSKASS